MDFINFVFPIDVEPNKAISKLIEVLDLHNLQFLTSKKFEDLKTLPYVVDGVTMTGKPEFVNSRLKEIRTRIIDYLNDYANSHESIETKIHMLGDVELLITEKLFYWDIEYPELYDSQFNFDLIDLDNYVKVVGLHELEIPLEIKKEIIQHHNVRLAFFELLIKYIRLLIKKTKYSNPNYTIEDNINSKSIDLLEIWLGLKEMRFLEGNEKNEINIRTDFFKLFGVPEIEYNDKHNQIKKRQKPKFIFVEKMLNKLNNAYEK